MTRNTSNAPGPAQSRIAAAQRQGRRTGFTGGSDEWPELLRGEAPGTGRATMTPRVSLLWWGLPSRRSVVCLESLQAVGELLAGKGLGSCGADIRAETGDFPDRDKGVQ